MKERTGGLIVVVGCLFLVAAAWWAWGITGLLAAMGIALVMYGIGGVLTAQDRERKRKFDEAKDAILKGFSGDDEN